jgi:hypothetical protein
MKAILAALVLAALAGPAWAGSYYDWQSGNSYNWNTTPGGDTYVHGYNLNTGSMWNQTIRPNGDQNGFDSRGNYWNYNAGTGSYFNSDGTTCFGRGAFRTCN